MLLVRGCCNVPRKKQTNSAKAQQNTNDDDATADITKSAINSITVDVKANKKSSDTIKSTAIPTYNIDEDELVDTTVTAKAGKRPVHVHVTVRQGESVEQMLRRFNWAVTRSKVIDTLKDNQFFEKPSKRRQREEKMRLTQRRDD